MKKKQFKLTYKKVTAERDGITVDIGNTTEEYRYVWLSADEHLRLISDLQEALLRRSMYDGFMRKPSYES